MSSEHRNDSNESNESNDWVSLTPSPVHHLSTALMLNNTELLIVSYSYLSKNGNSLYKYNVDTEEWIKWKQYPDFVDTYYSSAALNKDQSKLYVFGESGRIIEFNLNTQKFKQSKNKFHDGSHCQSIVIDNEFHIFGGWESSYKSHFIWDKEQDKLIEIHSFNNEIDIGFDIDDADGLNCHSIHYISAIQSILILPSNEIGTMHLYSLITHKCKLLPMKLNKNHPDSKIAYYNGHDSVMTKNEQYIIIFEYTIQILDLHQMIIRKSNIPMPNIKGAFRVTIRNNSEKEVLITSGYIRNISNESKQQFPPIYLIKSIASWYSVEFIHLFAEDKHLSIAADTILQV